MCGANLMIIEIFEDEEWVEREFCDITIGSLFRMRNPNTKELFVGDNNKTEFKSISEPYANDGGILSVSIEAKEGN